MPPKQEKVAARKGSEKPHSSHDEFFNQLGRMFQHVSSHGSVYMSQKPVQVPSDTDLTTAPAVSSISPITSDSSESSRVAILFRASVDKGEAKIKASTIVDPEHLSEFFARYTDFCKQNMTALKKRDRSKQKKNKAKKKKVAASAT